MDGAVGWWVSLWRPLFHNITTDYEPWLNPYCPGLSEVEQYLMDHREEVYHRLTEGGWWTVCLPLVATYLPLIFGLQRLMKRRAAFDLRLALIFWNLLLAAFSVMALWRTLPEFLDLFITNGWSKGFYMSICTARHSGGHVVAWAFFFGVAKAVELGDTVFIVLRKRPLIFLHYFHHIATMFYCFYTLIDWSSGSRWFISMNAFIHTIMYLYFAVKAAGRRLPLWVSMSLTFLQLTQMIVGTYVNYSTISYLRSGVYCEATYRNVYMCLGMYALYVILFGHFFLTNYFGKDRKKGKKSLTNGRANGRVHTNGKVHKE